MPIPVTCPGCHKRFTVSDKFAGKEGPCPNCKVTIKIPKEQVKVHGGEKFADGGRTAEGRLALKPIERSEAAITPVKITLICGVVFLVVAVAWALGGTFQESYWATAGGLLVVSPMLAYGGYLMLQSADDLDSFPTNELILRVLICGVAYAITWWIFGQIQAYLMSGELYEWFYVLPLFFLGGALALGCLDLDFQLGMAHYGFYVVATVILRWIAGLPWVWDAVEKAANGPPIPVV